MRGGNSAVIVDCQSSCREIRICSPVPLADSRSSIAEETAVCNSSSRYQFAGRLQAWVSQACRNDVRRRPAGQPA